MLIATRAVIIHIMTTHGCDEQSAHKIFAETYMEDNDGEIGIYEGHHHYHETLDDSN